MTQRTCGNCRWWYGRPGYTGECRIRSQQNIVAKEDFDFCGEWADKTITPKQEQKRELVRRFAVAIAHCEWCRSPAEEVWRLATKLADAEPGNSGREI